MIEKSTKTDPTLPSDDGRRAPTMPKGQEQEMTEEEWDSKEFTRQEIKTIAWQWFCIGVLSAYGTILVMALAFKRFGIW
ncbi:MAG: hypothetical protein M0Q91_12875 [Methanoregula sp.]|jgi:hypothetical protein|nr:hypothetical protein [Methanoregula sp.]